MRGLQEAVREKICLRPASPHGQKINPDRCTEESDRKFQEAAAGMSAMAGGIKNAWYVCPMQQLCSGPCPCGAFICSAPARGVGRCSWRGRRGTAGSGDGRPAPSSWPPQIPPVATDRAATVERLRPKHGDCGAEPTLGTSQSCPWEHGSHKPASAMNSQTSYCPPADWAQLHGTVQVAHTKCIYSMHR